MEDNVARDFGRNTRAEVPVHSVLWRGDVGQIRRSRAKVAVGHLFNKWWQFLATFRYQLPICYAHHLHKDGRTNQF